MGKSDTPIGPLLKTIFFLHIVAVQLQEKIDASLGAQRKIFLTNNSVFLVSVIMVKYSYTDLPGVC